MTSLVADYESDFSEYDEDVTPPIREESCIQSSHISDCKRETKTSANLLLNGPDAETSDSGDEQSSGELSGGEEPESPTRSRLPNPLVGIFAAKEGTESKISVGNSVFSTAYHAVEAAKRSVLEKHVKMTDDEIETRRKRPVCIKFKKGKCRFGVRCKHSHNLEDTPTAVPDTSAPKLFSHQPKFLTGPRSKQVMSEPVDTDSYIGQMNRKRRYGVKDSLVPPKKAMNDLTRQRIQDRPWTMDSVHRDHHHT